MAKPVEKVSIVPGPKNDRERVAMCVGLANILARWDPPPTAFDLARGIQAVMRAGPGLQVDVFCDEDVERLVNFVAGCVGVEPRELTPWLQRATVEDRMAAVGKALLCGSVADEPPTVMFVPPVPAEHIVLPVDLISVPPTKPESEG